MSGEIAGALLALSGVAVATVAQWFITRWTVRAESARLRDQLRIEFHDQQFAEWQSKFRDSVVALLASTDPELAANKDKIVPLVLKVQMMLDLRIPAHARVNSLVNQLALAVNGWEARDASSVLRLHGGLLEAARDATVIPGSALGNTTAGI
jgi:hypothetical protein